VASHAIEAMKTLVSRAEPLDWVRSLRGAEVVAGSSAQYGSIGVGHFHFDALPDQVEAPPMNQHYLSVTLSGSLRVEGILSGERVEGNFTPGQMLIMAAGQTNIWRWDRPTEEAHLYLSPRLLEQVAEASDVGRFALVDRFAFDDPALSQIILALVHEQKKSGGANRLFADSTAQYVAHYLLARHCSKSAVGSRAARLMPRQLRRVEACVRADLTADLSLAELARPRASAGSISRTPSRRPWGFRPIVGWSPSASTRPRNCSKPQTPR
jgi:AraC family transcriptional regulator